MNGKFHSAKRGLVAAVFIAIVAANCGIAGDAESGEAWKCAKLLDSQTKSDLTGYERFFNSLFTLPDEYDGAAAGEKSKLVGRWIKELESGNSQKKTEAAAYLGMVRAKAAAKALEKAIASPSGGGRTRWVCTRSLGRIGQKSSIPGLIELLDNPNRNTRVYAKVCLAEITGVFCGDDKEKWRSWEKYKGVQPETSSDHAAAVKSLSEAIDSRYSYRDHRGLDWPKLFERYGPQMRRAKGPREFAEAAAHMLTHARDMHMWVKIGDETVGGFKRKIVQNYSKDLSAKSVPGWREHNKYVSTGRFSDGNGYIMIGSWSMEKAEMLAPAINALKEFSEAPGLIIDVRPNAGGKEGMASRFAGCFVDKPVVYAKHIYKEGGSAGDWGPIQERTLRPNKDGPRYHGKVAVLMGRANMSSCEAFLLMMKQVRNCKLVGDKSYGSSGNPKEVDLGNGVTVWLPSWKALRPDETCFEGQGIEPDVYVRTSEWRMRDRDRVLENALRLLRREADNRSEGR